MPPSSLPSHHDRLNNISSESGLEFINSLTGEETLSGLGIDGLDSILVRYGFARGDIIDLFGGSSCGKTTLLYAICIATILPHQWVLRVTNDGNGDSSCHDSGNDMTLELGGKDKGVIFLDLDLGFDVIRLRQLFYLRIQSTFTRQLAAFPNDKKLAISQRWENGLYRQCVDELIVNCLDNIHIYTPSSASTTIATVRTLDQYLLKLVTRLPLESESTSAIAATTRADTLISRTTTHVGRHQRFRPVSILMIDSLSAFYWQERPQNNYSSFLAQLDRALQPLRTRWRLVVVFTTWSLHPSPEILYPESWRNKIKFRFTIAPKLLDRIPAHKDLVALWKTQFATWVEKRNRIQALEKDPWQIQTLSRLGETRDGDPNHLQATQESLSLDDDMEQRSVHSSSNNNRLKEQAEHEGDLFTAMASFFQVQMAHPQRATGRPFELFRFSVSDGDGIQCFSIPS